MSRDIQMPGRCHRWTGQRCELGPGAGAGGRAAGRVGPCRTEGGPPHLAPGRSQPCRPLPGPCPVAGPALLTRAAFRPREEEEAGDSLGAPVPATCDFCKPQGLESSGSQSWKWGKGSSVVPAVGRLPGQWGTGAATQEGCTNLTRAWPAFGLPGGLRRGEAVRGDPTAAAS